MKSNLSVRSLFLSLICVAAFALPAVAGFSTTTTMGPTPTTTVPGCFSNDDCSNEIFCDGAEVCLDGLCLRGRPPCRPIIGECSVAAPSDGSGTATGILECQVATFIGEDLICDEENDICVSPEECDDIIQFERLPEGAIIDTVFATGGTGPILVKGTNLTQFPASTDAAVIYDTNCPDGCSAGQDSLGTPNEDFAGPGIGEGGESGADGENSEAQNNMLIVTRTLGDTNPSDGLVDAPRPQGNQKAVMLDFDFGEVGPVSIHTILTIDVDGGEQLPLFELLDGDGLEIVSTTQAIEGGGNGVIVTEMPPNRGVRFLRVTLFGSGAIDDIAFSINDCIPEPPCRSDEQCSDGKFCNGIERCREGKCVETADPCPGQLCDEDVDRCVDCFADEHCPNDDLFCNGFGVCAGGTCKLVRPCPPDKFCNEDIDRCEECQDSGDCSNERFCDGAERCVSGQCSPGEPPCGDDAPLCNEELDRCEACESNIDCDDGVFCNGREICGDDGQCRPGSIACPDPNFPICVEQEKGCAECDEDSDCTDAGFCEGTNICASGFCRVGPPPCEDDEFCNDRTETCDECETSEHCGDLSFCNGNEQCVAGVCEPGIAPCLDDQICSERFRICADCLSHADCNDEQFCNGEEFCVPLDGDLTIGTGATADTPVVALPGRCISSGPPCRDGEICNERADTCDDIGCMDVIVFDGFAQGAFIETVFGENGTGPVGVKGTNLVQFPEAINAAVAFDSDCPGGCVAGQDALGTPNEDFFGPGIGAGGGSGADGENSEAMGNMLIVTRTLGGVLPPDGIVGLPRAQGNDKTVTVDFDFSEVGPVTIKYLDIVDVDEDEAVPSATLFDGGGSEILTASPAMGLGENSVERLKLPENSGVRRLRVTLNGSAAIDNIAFGRNECRDDPCEDPIVVGPCDAVIPRWAYDGEQGQCVPFNYGGCGGNGNNFETEEACMRHCPSVTTTTTSTTTTTTTLPPTGACCFSADCLVTTGAECAGGGGSYQGDLTSCTDGICVTTTTSTTTTTTTTTTLDNPCDPDPCVNGVCNPIRDNLARIPADFVCECSGGYTGLLCEVPPTTTMPETTTTTTTTTTLE